MRRSLIDRSRRKAARKRGGAHRRIDLKDAQLVTQAAPDDLLLMNITIDALARSDADAAQLAKPRFFAEYPQQYLCPWECCSTSC